MSDGKKQVFGSSVAARGEAETAAELTTGTARVRHRSGLAAGTAWWVLGLSPVWSRLRVGEPRGKHREGERRQPGPRRSGAALTAQRTETRTAPSALPLKPHRQARCPATRASAPRSSHPQGSEALALGHECGRCGRWADAAHGDPWVSAVAHAPGRAPITRAGSPRTAVFSLSHGWHSLQGEGDNPLCLRLSHRQVH